jgi:hypothetical protein
MKHCFTSSLCRSLDVAQRNPGNRTWIPFHSIQATFFILGLVLNASAAQAVTITVTADRDPAALNESFVLTFESDGEVDGEPDFSPLNRDFQILSTGQSSSMTIINGRVTASKNWTLNVMARRDGVLDIPPIAFGRDRSAPARINVVKNAAGGAAGRNRDVFLEAEVSADRPYVQSQIILTVRLFRSVATANATLTEPPLVSGVAAVIEKLGEDRSYDTRRQGDLYSVVERKYAIYPQASGRLTIEPVVFQGQISRGFSFFGNPFGRQPQTIVAQSDPVTLEVQPVPASFPGGQWLPARELALMEEWSDYPLQFRIDEPLTRTLTLTAEGLTSSQLPELPAWRTDAFKQYPDQPVLQDDKQYTGVTGRRVEKIALIPNRAGIYTLPEINIPWWNTDTDKLEYATIPERRIEVIAPAAGAGNPPPAISPAPSSAVTPPTGVGANQPAPVAAPDSQARNDPLMRSGSHFWQWLSGSLFTLWIITLLLWWRTKRGSRDAPDGESAQHSLCDLIQALKQACLDNQPLRTKEHLLRWGRMHWPDRPPASIGEVADRCGAPLAIEIRLLNNVLYGRNGGHWQGRDLWRAFEQELKARERKPEKRQGKLEPLFKI